MKNIEEIEQWLYDHNCRIIKDDTIIECEGINKAFVVKYHENAILVYAPSSILDDKDKRTVFVHEIYHFRVKNGFNYLNDSLYKRKVIEGRVNNKMVKDLIPFQKLYELSQKGCNTFEIATEFDVNEDLVELAYSIYESKFLDRKNKLEVL